MTYIKELIEIPEKVHAGDFVLRLTEGVDRPDATLGQYVVTENLVENFDRALSLIRGAVESGISKATYLDGSFGSGKSHFMAVLHLLLRHHAGARSIRELSPVLQKHDDWLEGKRFLLVPYHMIGARSMESAVLGRYVDYVQGQHPDAPLPGVYLSEGLFEDAVRLRGRMGDETFFESLNAGSEGGGGGWGELEASWDAARFEEALSQSPGSELHGRLVGDLVEHLFPSYRQLAESTDGAFVGLDAGLSILSKHAEALGYDALILFLDELILWLASHVADLDFVSREVQKVTKLVEAMSAERPVPLVSFVARQRDLRELIGEHVPGSERLGFADTLKWWEGRFDHISFQDRDLAAIAEKRLLVPVSDDARAEIDSAFEQTMKAREKVLDVLLTRTSTPDTFRKVYPFSPALVEALVAISSVLQRERTAIKVMLQLLVNQRDTLELGELIPVGDLYDVIAEQAEPFTEDLRRHFENAQRLYHQKLRPLLEKEYGIKAEEAAARPKEDAEATAFRNDDRLVKTLLLAALVPEADVFRELTAERLSALNHGTIRSPIPGQETQLVLNKVRKWASQVGEIKVGEGTNPTITVQLSGVDLESILDKARGNDSPGMRRQKIKELLFEQLEVPLKDELFTTRDVVWRGSRRSVDVIFGNVREMPDDTLAADGDAWKVIIDFPFDSEHHTAQDDLARVERYRSETSEGTRTIVWLPSFFSRDTQKDLGDLVMIEFVLASEERFSSHASHLSAVDRQAAKALLQNRGSQLRQRLILCLEEAYGVRPAHPGVLDAPLPKEDQFQSLDHALELQPPVGANLLEAFEHLVGQGLAQQFPAHPSFEEEVRLPHLRRVWGELEKAHDAEDGRLFVEQPLRKPLRQIANPLKLGEMHETHFLVGHRWRDHFLKCAAADGGPVTVEKLRGWTDEPTPMGLAKEVQNLIILSFADQTDRSFVLHGAPIEGSLDRLEDEVELREQRLPDKEVWETARERAAAIFGLTASPLRNAANVSKLADDVQAAAFELRTEADQLLGALKGRLEKLDQTPSGCERYETAREAFELVRRVTEAASEEVAGALAGAKLEATPHALGTSLKQAAAVRKALEETKWDLLEGAWDVPDEAAGRMRREVLAALQQDEVATKLGPVLERAESEAVKLLVSKPGDVQEPGPEPPSPPEPRADHETSGSQKSLRAKKAGQLVRELEAQFEDRVRIDVSWKSEDA